MTSYKGVYRAGFETSAFWPDVGGDGPWWVEGEAKAMAELQGAVAKSNGGMPWGGVAVELEGALSAPGAYGHLGAYQKKLTVKRVKSARPLDEGHRG